MHYQIIKPTYILSKYIKQYWALEFETVEPCYHRIIPHGLTEMLFHYNSDYYCYTNNGFQKQNPIAISGQKDTFYEVKTTGKIGFLSVMFYPNGANRFFPFSISELKNLSISLDEIFKNDSLILTEKLQESENLSDKIKILEAFLIERLYKQNNKQYNDIEESIKIINTTRGQIELKKILDILNISERQFERKFKLNVGINPKKFLRIIRFQNAIYLNQKNPTSNLTEIGYASGYYDQSHFIKEFKTFTGLSPKEYFACGLNCSDYFD